MQLPVESENLVPLMRNVDWNVAKKASSHESKAKFKMQFSEKGYNLNKIYQQLVKNYSIVAGYIIFNIRFVEHSWTLSAAEQFSSFSGLFIFYKS